MEFVPPGGAHERFKQSLALLLLGRAGGKAQNLENGETEENSLGNQHL